jgi:hypothetical protein
VIELLRSIGGCGGSLLGVGPWMTTLLRLSAGEGFGRPSPLLMRVWWWPLAVGDLGWPDAQVQTYLVAYVQRRFAGWRGGVSGGWRLLRATSILRRPLLWIWALPVDVGDPVSWQGVATPVSLVVGGLRGVLGNMAFASVPSRPAGIANFEPSIRRGFGRCNDDLTGMLTLLEAHKYCSQVLTCPLLVRHYGASAPKVRIDQEPRSLRRLRC